ncbi:Non-catalytic module family EXPN protein [Schizophyllum fasciatum]
MYAATFVAALATLSAVQALPVNPWHHARKEKPDTYAEGYLEDYDVYHSRYLAIGCQNQHNTQFFDDCCHPMLATETLQANRAAYCDPANISTSAAAPSSTAVEASSSAPAVTSSSAEPAVTSGNTQVDAGNDDDDDDYEDCDDDDYEDGDDEESSSQEAPASTSSSEQAQPTSSEQAQPTSTYEEPQTTSQAPETTSTSESAPETTSTGGDSGSGSSGDLTGTATFFYQNGVAGSCGTVHADSDYVAAMTPGEYGRSGDICGKSVHITNTETGQEVDVTVADTCPTCLQSSDIDLSEAAFNAIGKPEHGVESIKWHYN